MRKYFIVTVIFSAMGVAIAFLSPQPAGAFVTNQNGVAKAATTTNAIIEVKRSLHKGTPPGWHHGRKVGWHGHSRPPGQL
jgi:hypothetical protein